ncbi:MAG: hypothetical protein HY782_08575 [Chloroflexi bacterium]|nr:hypothetical protein [Chloroflexota bacterium]
MVLGALAIAANVVTLFTFVVSNNWQVPTIMGTTKWNWAIWVALLSFYSVSVISAVIIKQKRKRNRERKKDRPSLFVFDETDKDDGMEFWVHMPFSMPIFVLWIQTFVEFPSFGDSTAVLISITMVILMLALLYIMAVLLPMVGLTHLLLRVMYD